MGFLSDIGRANVGAVGRGFLSDAVQAGQFIQNSGLVQMQIQQEKIKLEEAQKQQAHLDQVVDFRMTPFYLSLPESVRPQTEQMFRSLGGFDENYRGTRRQMYAVVAEIEKNKDAFKVLSQPVIEAKGQEVVKAFGKMRANPQDAAARVAYETARMDYETANGKMLEHLSELDKGTVVPAGATLVRPGQPDFTAPDKEGNWLEETRNIGGKDVIVRRNLKTGKVEQVSTGPTVTNVNVGVNTGLEKAARTKAQEEVQEGTDLYKGVENLIRISRPEYFTYAGQLKAGAQRIGEKAGVVSDTQFLKGYSGWKVAVEQEFNKYRKWVTGVASGEKELERLSNSFPNINMSKTQFDAAAKQTFINSWKLVERRRRALAAGIMDPRKQKRFYELVPLDKMPEPPPEVLQGFSADGGKRPLSAFER